MRRICFIILACCLLCSCEKKAKHDSLIGWEITFGVNAANEPAESGLTPDQLDSLCSASAKEIGYQTIGSNHVIIHDVSDRRDIKEKTMDFAWCVDDKVKALWGKEVKVDSRYNKLQIVFDFDYDSETDIIAIYRYK